MLQTIFISNKRSSFLTFKFIKEWKKSIVCIVYRYQHWSFAFLNQHIRMNSEGSCDTEE